MRTPTASTVLHRLPSRASAIHPRPATTDWSAPWSSSAVAGSWGKKGFGCQTNKSKTRLDFAQHGEGCHTAPHRPHQKRRKRTACILHTHPREQTHRSRHDAGAAAAFVNLGLPLIDMMTANDEIPMLRYRLQLHALAVKTIILESNLSLSGAPSGCSTR